MTRVNIHLEAPRSKHWQLWAFKSSCGSKWLSWNGSLNTVHLFFLSACFWHRIFLPGSGCFMTFIPYLCKTYKHWLCPNCHQTATLRPYLNAVRATLQAALCLENFSSQVVERHNKPEVEVRYAALLCGTLPLPHKSEPVQTRTRQSSRAKKKCSRYMQLTCCSHSASVTVWTRGPGIGHIFIWDHLRYTICFCLLVNASVKSQTDDCVCCVSQEQQGAAASGCCDQPQWQGEGSNRGVHQLCQGQHSCQTGNRLFQSRPVEPLDFTDIQGDILYFFSFRTSHVS